jgi:hypothetical protein
VSLWGPHLGINFAKYLRWTIGAILPLVPFRAAAMLTLGVLAAAILLEGRAAGPLASPGVWARGSAQYTFLAVWFVVGLLPVLPLPNHTYRYYAELALPAGILVWWQAVFAIARRLSGAGFASNAVAAAMLILVVVISGVDVRQRVASQRDWDGSNQPLERTHIVARVQPLVRSGAQQLAGQATLLIDGLEVWSFGKEHGPRLWLNNPGLQVFSTAHLQVADGGELAIVDAPMGEDEVFTGARNRTPLDPSRTFVIHENGGGGLRMDPVQVFLEQRAKRAPGS